MWLIGCPLLGQLAFFATCFFVPSLLYSAYLSARLTCLCPLILRLNFHSPALRLCLAKQIAAKLGIDSRAFNSDVLYLAVSEAVFVSLFEEPIGRLLLDNHRVRLVVFDLQREVIHQWTP